MVKTIYLLAIAIVVFALAGEADTVLLRVLGTILAVWFALLGAMTGWLAARE